MKALGSLLLVFAALWPAALHAASDKPVMAPAPDWVKPVGLPPGAGAKEGSGDEAPIRLLLSDQQVMFEPGKETVYTDIALRIQTPQGLAAGNLSFPWNPETNVLTVHRLVIHRGEQTIDVLGSGQTFTVVRREPNLESATLDGMLTANIQPEGLQVGDILEFALSVTSSDPVLKGHVEEFGAAWNGLPVDRAHFKLSWPSSMPIKMRQSASLPPIKPVTAGGVTSVELALQDIQPIIPPRGAPARFSRGRIMEFSDFKSWADLSILMAPLYEKAATIPAQGPLRDELEKIRAANPDPVMRAQAALTLVQDRVRYVALLMGAGGYVPANAAETWSRRYGDCKAKTALLLGLLHELGVAAEPVAVNLIEGDGMDERLPMVGLFNHVLVRVHIAGKDFWLDGTRTGDTSLARLRVPDFGWGLPLVAKGAALVRMLPPPLETPEREYAIEIDATKGLSQPAGTRATIVMRGDQALGTRLALAQLTEDQRNKALRDFWRDQLSDLTVAKATASYDPATGEETIGMEGTTQMDWTGGWYSPDRIGQGYDADLSREPGPGQDAPFANAYPDFVRTRLTIKLPPGFPSDPDFASAKVDETIGATAYYRKASLKDGVFTIEATTRELAPEFPATQAPAAEKAFRALKDRRVSLRRPDNLRMTAAELDAALKETPENASAYVDRGNELLNSRRFKEAIADFDAALKLEPTNLWALADRGIARAWRQEYDAATKDLDAAQAIDPRNVIVFHGRGLVAAGKGDNRAAIAAYDQAIILDPKNSFALGQRAQLHLKERNFSQACADAEAALALDPQWTDLLDLQVTALRGQGKRDEALAHVRSMVDTNPNDPAILKMAGFLYRNLGAVDLALSAISRVIEAKPEAGAYLTRAALRQPGDLAGREADIDKALKLAPDLEAAEQAKIYLLFRKGAFAEVVKRATTMIAQYPYLPTLFNQRGVAYAKLGDKKRSEADFAAAREEADSAARLNALCYLKATAAVALERALAECEAALVEEPDSPAILDSKALVLLRMGRLDEAKATYDSALAKSPDLAPALFGRAVTWSRKGDMASADADLAAARLSNPLVDEEFASIGVTP